MLLRNSLFTTAITLLVLFICLCPAQAQSSEAPKIEIGTQFSLLRIRGLEETNPGVGGRLTWNITDNVAVEGEMNFFPERSNISLSFTEGRKVQGQFGLKTGLRSDKYGIFAKIRPGFVHFDRILSNNCPQGSACATIIPLPASETKFSLDVGGVLEYYPSRHTMVRFDLGNTIIRFSDRNAPQGTSSNLQFSTGFGFRF